MDLSFQKLTQALSLRQQISALEQRLSSLFAGGGSSASSTSTSSKGSRKRKPMSAATRAKLAVAAKARWAQRKGMTLAKAPAKKKGGLTAAGRKKLSDAMKARWAARRRAAKK
jgi:hypothetical protein